MKTGMHNLFEKDPFISCACQHIVICVCAEILYGPRNPIATISQSAISKPFTCRFKTDNSGVLYIHVPSVLLHVMKHSVTAQGPLQPYLGRSGTSLQMGIGLPQPLTPFCHL